MKLFTWLDVRRTISRETIYGSKLPEGVVRIRCFSDAVEIGLRREEHKQNAKNVLKQWFKDWYEEDKSIIYFTLGDATLPVEFIPGEEPSTIDISVRPFWEEISYVEAESEDKTPSQIVKLPEPFTEKPYLIAFYSFKGGVGRTLNLAAHIFALLERAKEIDESIKILIIDADLEAPGLTYWNRSEKQQPTVCFIDFLEAYHYSPINQEETLSLLAKEIKKSSKEEGKSTLYFLPACLDDEQLLDTPILPEHLVKSPDGTWECGNAIHRLGKAVGVDYVLIDLRAGLSEISSPIIFDPRIQRFLVTTINDQSVKGTSLVLEQIGRVAPPEPIDDERYYDASLLISMLTPELKSLPAFEEALVEFQSAYVQPQEDNLYSTRLDIKESYFAQELLYVNSWEEARSKLNSTSVMNVAKDWAERELFTNTNEEKIPKQEKETDTILEEVRKLKDVCQRYEYAEGGQGEDLLVTEPLQNLATNFKDQLPHVVSIGAKGAGKTFNYIQLSRFKYWENFLARINNTKAESHQETYIFPLLQSGKLQDSARNIINQARDNLKKDLYIPDFKPSEYVDRIKRAISEENWSEPQWTEFWVSQIAASIDTPKKIYPSISNINTWLKSLKLRIIFIFDGLEDIFPNIASNDKEKIALKSLIDDLPSRLSEIRESNIGVIIFLRRDFLRYTITQNLKQFESLYRAYDLSWDQDSFLRLVFWICSQAEVINANEENIQTLGREEIKEKLEKLWGKRLGSDKSKEAYTASWVYAALTDFNGRLQARDIVRLLYHAANITVDRFQEVQFAKWSTSRLLPPQAIRRALQPCSKAKVDEAKEEYVLFKRWVEETLQLHPPAQRRIPFDVQQFNMEPQTVRTLEEMGVIYEDKEKEDSARFYMPEIFREGLDFSAKGARPRVLALKRKILGRGIL
ncbi:KGGVGR-motif variant AAA ATPase [Calothrix sp. CCY 0018]|uniref:KGGVGR-motif variant AAA ATPase n=1 Tax=Calothrix sp. CCY 0018 TaxID=3103864 RepID=UPI0039C60448